MQDTRQQYLRLVNVCTTSGDKTLQTVVGTLAKSIVTLLTSYTKKHRHPPKTIQYLNLTHTLPATLVITILPVRRLSLVIVLVVCYCVQLIIFFFVAFLATKETSDKAKYQGSNGS